MTALNDNDCPPLASEVLTQLQKWPGDPSLAVVGEKGILGFHDSVRTYRLASVTKLLTALTVLSAAESGFISLRDPAGPSGSTVLHLLAHVSGVDFEDGKVRAPAGSRRIYSNAGINLAAAHLSARSGKEFKDEMRDRVLEPLGMHHTALPGAPSKGGEGTIGDIALLARELLKPAVFPESVVETLSSLAFPGLSGFLPGFGHHADNGWGAGAEIRGTKSPHWTSPDNSPSTFGHFGITGSFLWVDRSAGLACAALSTVDFGPWAPYAWPDTSTAVLGSYSLTRHRPVAQASTATTQAMP